MKNKKQLYTQKQKQTKYSILLTNPHDNDKRQHDDFIFNPVISHPISTIISYY